MCGILVLIGDHNIENEHIGKLKALISERGPDYSSPLLDHPTQCGLKLRLAASVLHLRGDKMQVQPLIDSHGDVLLFNGQVYRFSGNEIEDSLSDTLFLSRQLHQCNSGMEIAKIFASIDGSYSFVYWNAQMNCLFYGRDFFGRRSLCILSEDQSSCPLAISSVATHSFKRSIERPRATWSEVTCDGIYCLEFDLTGELTTKILHVWNRDLIFPKTSKCREQGSGFKTIPLEFSYLKPLNNDARICSDFTKEEMQQAIEGLRTALTNAIRKRIKYNKRSCLLCRKKSPVDNCDHSKVAIAFSGGLDSTILAIILDGLYKSSETIDLVTVAFKEGSPDRESVGLAFRELRHLRPARNWRLVLADLTVQELQDEREKVIRDLITPCNSVVDDSLGCACWFIGRAKGRSLDSLMDDDKFNGNFDKFLRFNSDKESNEWADQAYIAQNYRCPATMLFVGAGIDEQLGGYSSHRIAWLNRRNLGIFEEISLQMRRLPSRNLGRDDRVYSHHGRDLKLPFLDYHLISYLNQLPIGLKMNLDESLDIGPKKLLRELASLMGLSLTSKRPKRAMQFGTRIAKLEKSDEKGNDLCSRLR